MRLNDVVEQLHEALERAGVPHAFGGAIALAYCIEEPRATADVDVDVFLSPHHVEEVFAALPSGVSVDEADVQRVQRDGQVRLRWEDVPVDLFFGHHEFQVGAEERVRVVPFGEVQIPVLDCTDLAVFKAIYGRPRDLVDIQQMHEVASVDVAQVKTSLTRLLGEGSPEARRLEEALFPNRAESAERLRRAFRPVHRPPPPSK